MHFSVLLITLFALDSLFGLASDISTRCQLQYNTMDFEEVLVHLSEAEVTPY